MQVSSATSSDNSQALSADTQKKAMQVQERQIEQIIQSSQEQSQQMAAQKTGIGANLNITA